VLSNLSGVIPAKCRNTGDITWLIIGLSISVVIF
jgi:hypothetical protein